MRIRPQGQARTVAERFAPDAPDTWHAQLWGYQIMPSEQLLEWQSVTMDDPPGSLAVMASRTSCMLCDEEIINGREVWLPAA